MNPQINDILDSSVKAVILDLDGTIYDKKHLMFRMLVQLSSSWLLLLAERFARKKMKGISFNSSKEFEEYFFSVMAHRHSFTPQMARDWYFTYFMPTMVSILEHHYHQREWVMPLIVACRARGIKVAVYSDYNCVGEKLIALSLSPELFDVVVSAPELGGLKPSKTSAEKVLNMLHVSADNSLFIGDREDTDGATAYNVGAKFLLYNESTLSIFESR